MTDLGEFVPYFINNRGEIAGTRFVEGEDPEIDPLMYRPGKGMTILPRPESMPLGIAFGISNNGRCVGIVGDFEGERKAAVWEEGKLRLLSQRLSLAYAINDRGQAVGVAQKDRSAGAVLWSDNQEIFLNDVVSRSEGYLLVATSINNRGQIAGSGFLHGRNFGYLLTPKER